MAAINTVTITATNCRAQWPASGERQVGLKGSPAAWTE